MQVQLRTPPTHENLPSDASLVLLLAVSTWLVAHFVFAAQQIWARKVGMHNENALRSCVAPPAVEHVGTVFAKWKGRTRSTTNAPGGCEGIHAPPTGICDHFQRSQVRE